MSFKCLRCGWCCANMSPLTSEYCPHLSYEGKKAVCAIYPVRPQRCKNEEMGHTPICMIGMSVLNLTKIEALQYWRDLEQEDDIKAINQYLKENKK